MNMNFDKNFSAKHVRRTAAALALPVCALALTVLSSPTQAQYLDPVLERQLIMQQLEENSMELGNVLAGIRPPEDLPVYAGAIARDAKEVRESFQSKEPGGGTKPEVWSNWEDFSMRLDSFVAETEKMAEIAETGDISAVGEMAATALQCRECHMIYRNR